MPHIEHQGQRVFFEDLGAGPAIVLGHSFLCSGEMWRQQVPRLAESRRVINIDFRGHGNSGAVRQPFTLYDLVNDVVAVLDHLEIDRAVWAGLSIGGMVALRAAIRAPERVSALILLDTDAGSEPKLAATKYRAMGWGAGLLGMRPFLPAVVPRMFGATTRRERPDLVGEWKEHFGAVDVPSMRYTLGALMGRDSILDRLPQIDVPTLVIVGEEDAALPQRCSNAIAAGIAQARYRSLPRCGHLSALEHPETVTEWMLDFLKKSTRESRI